MTELRQDVSTAAAHILSLLDSVQEQLAKIRRTAEVLQEQQREATVDAPDS